MQEIYEGSLAQSVAASGVTGIDPRRRRFGYSPGIFQMQLDPIQSGQQQAVMPAGVPIPFRTVVGKMEENFDIAVSVDEYQKQVYRDALATFFIANVKTSYEEFGFRELSSLTMLDDPEREPSKEKRDGTSCQVISFLQVTPKVRRGISTPCIRRLRRSAMNVLKDSISAALVERGYLESNSMRAARLQKLKCRK